MKRVRDLDSQKDAFTRDHGSIYTQSALWSLCASHAMGQYRKRSSYSGGFRGYGNWHRVSWGTKIAAKQLRKGEICLETAIYTGTAL